MRTLARFDCDINALAKELLVDADTIKRKVALDIYAQLLAKTPVDTGRARAGWSISAERPGNDAPPEDKSGYGYDRAKTPSPYMVPKNAQIICVYNNVEYIMQLNNGHSAQAPAMFVEQAVDAVMGGLRA